MYPAQCVRLMEKKSSVNNFRIMLSAKNCSVYEYWNKENKNYKTQCDQIKNKILHRLVDTLYNEDLWLLPFLPQWFD